MATCKAFHTLFQECEKLYERKRAEEKKKELSAWDAVDRRVVYQKSPTRNKGFKVHAKCLISVRRRGGRRSKRWRDRLTL